MSADDPLHPPEPVVESAAGQPFRPNAKSILAGVALVVLFAVVAIAPVFTWLSNKPADENNKEGERLYLTGFGTLTVQLPESELKGDVSGEGAPQGLLIAIVAGVFALVAVIALAIQFIGKSRDRTQPLLRFASAFLMMGAIVLVVWQILWIWKIRSVSSHMEDMRHAAIKEAEKHGFGLKLPATMVGPGLGLYVGLVASVLALVGASGLSSAAGKRGDVLLRIGEGAGIVLGAAMLAVVTPWEGEDLIKAIRGAKGIDPPTIQKVRE